MARIARTLPRSGTGDLVQGWRRGLVSLVGALLYTSAFAAQLCATPGKDGPTINGGTYYPAAVATASAGSSSVTIGTARVDANASQTAITTGDLVMVIQMQDATINNSDSISYGNGSAGQGFTALGNSGIYEFKVVQSVAGSVITFTTPLANTYTNAAATATSGKKSFQIVRVPQYSSITISGTLSVPAWDGSTGGVFAIDVAGTLTLNGTIDASGKGFRGGGSVLNQPDFGNNVLDYAAAYQGINATNNLGAYKGEGIAGTPQYVRDDTVTTAYNGKNLGASGYPNNLDLARGAPGNAGGGGTQHNSGGGGGGNVGTGGMGGRSFGFYSATNTGGCLTLTSGATTYYSCNGDGSRAVGGLGGIGQTATINRLYLGGGGGAGDSNDASTDNPNIPQGSGGAGGGMIFIRAGSIAGSGSLIANGQAGHPAGRDGAGGGGSGGTIVVQAATGSYAISASANGGAGGGSGVLSPGQTTHAETQGPGGGGGGGAVILATGVSIASASVAAGASGINTQPNGLTNSYGSQSGSGGIGNFPQTITTPLASACVPQLTVTKSATPSTVVNSASGTTTSYTVAISNATNQGTAQNVVLSDALPAGFTYGTGATVAFSGGSSGTSPPANSGNTTTPVFNNFSLPGGAAIQINFPVAIASTVAPGTYPNIGHAKYDDPLRSTAGAKVDVASTAANVVVYNDPAGIVYNDANANGSQDGTETSTGLAGLYVKVATYAGGVCQTPALQAAAVDQATGTWAITATLPNGSYCLILDNNNNLADATPSAPAGWIGTEASSGIRIVTVGSAVIPPQNFGLYHGSTLSGRVFGDTGSGGGTANDGVQNGSESGIAGATITALNGATVIASTTTDASGNYSLTLPSATGTAVTIAESLPANVVATGGSAGTTAGTYTRATNATAFSFISGQTYSGVNFANAPASTFAPDNTQTTGPGTTVFYAHTFTPGSGGKLSFSSVAASSPTLAGWSESIYQDTNCNGKLDAGEAQVAAALTVTAGTPVCVIVREFVPANATQGMQNKVTLSASLVYTYPGDPSPATAPTATYTRTDLTTTGSPAELVLTKAVRNVTRSTAFATSNTGSPGDTVEYQLTFANQGTLGISNVIVNDATPAYTTYVSGACPATIPASAGLTGCSIAVQPAVGAQGAVQWNFSGSMQPGATLAVTYQVRINP